MKMLDQAIRVGFSRWTGLPTAALAAWMLVGCEGKVRPWPDLADATVSAQPPTETSSAGSSGASGRTRGGEATPGALDNSQSQTGVRGGEVACSGDGDAGSCPPKALCSADAGDLCEATCPG